MSRRPHYHRLDSLEDDDGFVWTTGDVIEHGTVLYRDADRVYVRLDRGRGMVCEEWSGNTLVHKIDDE